MKTQSYIKKDLEEVLKAVAAAFAVKPRDIIGRRRFGWLINPRFTTYFLLRKKGWSFEAVAQACGGRDHGAVMHGIKTLQDRIETEKALGKALVRLREEGYEL
jgi:chromosomal replication initiator protein